MDKNFLDGDQGDYRAGRHSTGPKTSRDPAASTSPTPDYHAERMARLNASSEPVFIPADDEPSDRCTSPTGHEWAYTGTTYGGDDESYNGEGRCYCVHCGADGDA